MMKIEMRNDVQGRSSDDCQTDEQPDPFSDNGTKSWITGLLQPLRRCSDRDEQIQALRILAKYCIDSDFTYDADDDERHRAQSTQQDSQPRQRKRQQHERKKLLAIELIQNVVVLLGSNEASHVYLNEALLMGCGSFACLEASIETIHQLAASANGATTCAQRFEDDDVHYSTYSKGRSIETSAFVRFPQHAMDVSLELIRRILLEYDSNATKTTTEDNNRLEQVESNSNDPPGTPSLLQQWIAEVLSDAVSESSEEQAQVHDFSLYVLDEWIQRLILLPNVISNANANLSSSLSTPSFEMSQLPSAIIPLPDWCSTASKFHRRLVECACHNILLLRQQQNRPQPQQPLIQGAGEGVRSIDVNNENTLPLLMPMQYFCRFVQRLVLRRGSGEEVVEGLYECYRSRTKKNTNTTPTKECTNATCLNDNAVMSDTWDNLRERIEKDAWHIISHGLTEIMIPKQISILCRDLVLHYVSSMEQLRNIHEFADDELDPWLKILCVQLLRSSKYVQDEFVQITILSPKQQQLSSLCLTLPRDRPNTSRSSVLTSPYKSYSYRLSYNVALLLSKIEESGINDDDSSTGSDSSDEDNEQSQSGVLSRTALGRQILVVAKLWCQTVFVQQADHTTQRHVSNFVQHGLRLLPTVQEEAIHPLFSRYLLQGITERLHCNIDTIRKDGMRVAVQLAKRLGQKLKFDELDEEEVALQKEEARARVSSLPAESSSQTNVRAKTKPRRRRTPKQMDPDAEYVSDSEDDSSNSQSTCSQNSYSDDDSIWSDDSALRPYAQHDDEEDLRETPLPLYLRECLDLLRTPETEEKAWSKYETAFEALPGLIKSHPGDIPDVGPVLACQLLRMEDKFHIERFDERRSNLLCALTVEEPVLVGSALIEEIFEEGSLTDRTNVLSALMEAAQNLSGNKCLHYRADTATESSPDEASRAFGKLGHTGSSPQLLRDTENGANVSADESTQLSTSAGKTRRWGRGRTQVDRPLISSKFIPVAPVWFYSLVGHFLKSKDETFLWEGYTGSALLARFFLTLSVIAECCGLHPSTQILAKDLFDLVWGFREADISEVRAAVLCTVGATLGLLQDEVLLALLCGDGATSGDNLVSYLTATASMDPDDACRLLARDVFSRISRSTQAIDMV